MSDDAQGGIIIAVVGSTIQRSRRGRTGPARIGLWGPPLLVLIAIIGAWYLVSYVILAPTKRFLLPAPHVVASVFANPKTLADVSEALLHTAEVALAGLAIAIVIGVLWAIAMSQARSIERSLFPYAVMLQSIPILAVVPLIGFWFGYDFPARTMVCVLIALFPMVANTLFGLQSVDKSQRELFKLQGASRWIVLKKLEFPTALPAIFLGMRTSAGLSVVGAIVGDFFFQRGTPGIGSLIAKYTSRLQSPELLASVILASLFGVLVFSVFGWLRTRAVGKWYDAG
jgi:NitT/TauT family transport system permease protein